MEWLLEIEDLPTAKQRRGHVIIRTADRKIIHADYVDLGDQKDRRHLAQALATKLAKLTDPDASVSREPTPEDQAALRKRLQEAAAAIEKRLEELFIAWLDQRTQPAARPEPTREMKPCYEDNEGNLCWIKILFHGLIQTRVELANFTARIVQETIRDDGVEHKVCLTLQGKLFDGRPLPRIEVPAERFAKLDWVIPHWGTEAIIAAGQGIHDHVRCAVQTLSTNVARRVVHLHTGWKQLNGEWVFLHAGGAIGSKGAIAVETDLPMELAPLALPDPSAGEVLVTAIRASLRILDLGPERITATVLGFPWRAVLGRADFAGHLCGRTGTFKTELAALVQQYFGADFHARNLPANWSSTSNAVERLSFDAKDAVLIVDDFAPTGSAGDIARLNREADRLFRGAGNRSSRQRMNADGTLRPLRPPRALLLSTGEDIPKSHSVRARVFIIEVGEEDIDATKLTVCQRDGAAGLYAQTMAGFLHWLAPRFGDIQASLATKVEQLRPLHYAKGRHRRTPSLIADLLLGWQYFLEFATEKGALTAGESEQLWQRVRKALEEVGKAQAEHHGAVEPAEQFLRLLQAVLASGRAHVASLFGQEPASTPGAFGWRQDEFVTRDGSATGARWHAQGRRLGWVEGDNLYLEPEAAYAEAQELARAQGESLPVSPVTLRKRLKEKGLLASTEKGKLVTRRTLEDKERYVVHLWAHSLMPQKQGEEGEEGETPQKHEEKPPIPSPCLNGLWHTEPKTGGQE